MTGRLRKGEKMDLLDNDGYPSSDALYKISVWDFSTKSMDDFLNMVQEMWSYKDRFRLKGKNVLRLYLSTGGWSGNESIIQAMQENYCFWGISWQKSRRGGHYWFRIKKSVYKPREKK